MDDFEKQIREALARKEPSPGFEARVLAAAGRIERRSWWQFPFVGRVRWASAAVATVMVITAVAWRHERAVEERNAGEAAKARLELALKITSGKLSRIQQLVETHESN